MEATEPIQSYNLSEEEEKKEILRQYRALLKVLKSKLKPGDKMMLRNAFEIAAEAHKTMRRKSGEPYILHPLAVAKICAEEIGLGIRSAICALLHDTVEDTDVTLEDIQREFGSEISKIVDGLTKISTVMDSNTTQQAENFKKILLTLTDDPRVILIKLADRLHNAPLRLFFRGVRDINSSGGPFHFLCVGDEQAVTERLEILRSGGLLLFRFRSHTQSSF